MSQVSDYNIANASGASVRSDLNLVFDAIKTLNSGGSDPSNTAAFMPYVDTADNNNLKIRNSANNAFTTIGPVDTANLGLIPASGGTMTGQFLADDGSGVGSPAYSFDTDTDTGFFRAAANVIGVATAGSQRMLIDQNGDIALGVGTIQNGAKLNIQNDSQVVASFECQAVDPQIYLGDNMASATDNTLIIGYDRAENRGYLVIAGDSDFAGLSVQNGGSVGVGRAATTEKFEVSAAIKSLGSASDFNNGGEGTIIDFNSTFGRIGTVIGGSGNAARALTFIVGGSEKARISETGKFLVGDTVDITGAGTTAAMNITGGDLRVRTEGGDTRRIYFLQKCY